jgi:ADP-heptose:LPS heptosyltransferase
LKLIFKNAEIDVWVKSRSKEILEGNEDVNDIIIFDDVKTEQSFEMFNINYKSKLAFLKKLRRSKYDLVIDFTGLFSTALFTYFMKPLYSIGKYEQGFGFLYNKFIGEDFSKIQGHLILKYMNIIKNAFDISDEEWLSLIERVPPKGIIYLNDDNIFEIENMLLSRGIDLLKPLICIHLTAGWSAKRWSLENFGQLIKTLINSDCEIAVVGNVYDKKEFSKVISSIQSLVPQKNLNSLFFDLSVIMNAALIKRSNLFIGSDSLPLHIAGAVGTPSIGLFGPTNPDFSNPIGQDHHYLYKILDCSSPVNHQYCTRNAGRTCNTIDCMKMISTDDVLQMIKEVIKVDNLLEKR